MRKMFELYGEIGIKGIEFVGKQLRDIDKQGKALSRSLGKLGRDFERTGTNVTKMLSGPIIALFGGMTLLAGKTAEYADKLTDLVEITGLSTDTLQEMEQVARVAGVSFETFISGITKFTKKIPELSKGTGAASEAMKELGVKVFDSSGYVRNMNDLFPETLKKLSEVRNVTERNSMAQAIFGRGLEELAPVLGLTADQLEGARKQAHELGLVLSGESLDSAAEYAAMTKTLTAQFEAAYRTLAMQFIPILRDDVAPIIQKVIVPAISRFIDKIKGVSEWFRKLNPDLKEGIIQYAGLLAILGPTLIIVGKVIGSLKALTGVLALVKIATMGVTTAMLANPWLLAAAAAITLTTAIYGTVKAYQKLNKEQETKNAVLEKTARQTEFIASTNYLTAAINNYGEAVKNEAGLNKLLGSTVEGLVQQAGKLGYTVEGTNKEKIEALKTLALEIQGSKDYTGELKTNSEAIKEVSKATKDKKRYTEEELAAMKKVAEERLKIETEYSEKLADLLTDELGKIDSKEKEALALAKKSGANISNITAYYAKMRAEYYAEETQKETALEEEKYKKKIDFEKDWTGKLLSESSNKKAILEAEKETALQAAKELGADKTNIVLYYSNLIAKAEADTKTASLDAFKNKVQSMMDIYSQFASGIMNIANELSTNQQIATDNWYNSEKSAIENSKMNAEQKKTAIEKLDNELEQKKKASARKQAIADKLSALFSIGINTAVAVVKALPNVFLAAAIGIMGGIQAAIVAARPIPLAKGGMIKGRRGGIQAEIGEGKEDELVFPLKTGVSMLANDLLSRLSDLKTGIQQASTATQSIGFAGSSASGGSNKSVTEHHWHIGTFIGDDRGIKELERRLVPFRYSETTRKGGN